MNKKKLLSLALVVIMVAMLSFGTLAWFSDSDSVTNNFAVAGGEAAEPDEIFSVDVLETVKDESGKESVIGKEGDATSDSTFTYENIAPAEKLLQDGE